MNRPPALPTLAASLIIMPGTVFHRVGYLWSDGWFESVAEFEDPGDARAAYYAAHLELTGRYGLLQGMTGKAV